MELLAPAGSLEKLKYAINFGADAVYAAGKQFGLRAKASNLTNEEIEEAVEFCHERGKKIYITLNIFAHNEHIEALKKNIKFLSECGVDAVIISDPAILQLVSEIAPNLEIHLSTQANTTSWKSVEFWYNLGVSRIILARELSFEEIKEIKEKVPKVELEMFVHGAMCIAYSGRCLLSSIFNQRSANLGECSQPCRWEYDLIEKKRPNQKLTIGEDLYGTYIMNSKDLALFRRIKELKELGVDSIKIEGRMKSLYYTANISRVYRQLIDQETITEDKYKLYEAELNKVSHRKYTEAFYEGFDSSETQYHEDSAYERNYQFLGEVIGSEDNLIEIKIRAKFSVGEKIDFVFPNIEDDFSIEVSEILDEYGNNIDFTKPNTTVKLPLEKKILSNGILRKKI